MKDYMYIKPSVVNSGLSAPASKSMMQRAVAAAYLSSGECILLNPSFCDDSMAALDVIKNMGAEVQISKDKVTIYKANDMCCPLVSCGESGLSLRMFSAILSLNDKEITLTGKGSLLTRPVSMITEPLGKLGVECKTNNGKLPVIIKGPLKAGNIEVDASITSQFLTGLLMALPLCEGDSEVFIKNIKSKPYIVMTLKLMEHFGLKVENRDFKSFHVKGCQKYIPCTYTVEGDWSGAAFLLVAGAVSGKVVVDRLNTTSVQADAMIKDIIKSAGATVVETDNSILVEKNKLKAFDADITDAPDLFPPLVALAVNCEGISKLYGVQRLKHKESDREKALSSEFTKIGGKIEIFDDRMEVHGSVITGGTVDSYNDHRIAMACAVAGLNSKDGVKVTNWECVNKSYPGFFDDLSKIGVTVI